MYERTNRGEASKVVQRPFKQRHTSCYFTSLFDCVIPSSWVRSKRNRKWRKRKTRTEGGGRKILGRGKARNMRMLKIGEDMNKLKGRGWKDKKRQEIMTRLKCKKKAVTRRN